MLVKFNPNKVKLFTREALRQTPLKGDNRSACKLGIVHAKVLKMKEVPEVITLSPFLAYTVMLWLNPQSKLETVVVPQSANVCHTAAPNEAPPA